jgi:hypothetical protein
MPPLKILAPDTPLLRGNIRRDELGRIGLLAAKFLRQNGELGAVFVDANVRATHPSLAREGRAAVQNSVIVDDYIEANVKCSSEGHIHDHSPTAVPADSCTQYSESGLVSSFCQTRIASYLKKTQ